MCGNFSQKSKVEVLAKKYGIEKNLLFEPNDDIYPWNDAYVVGQGKEGPGISKMMWGLIPTWFKGSLSDARKKFKFNFNARGEELLEKASYKDPYQKGQRCILFCDRFQEPFGGRTEKYDFYKKEKAEDDLLSIAALWNRWQDSKDNETYFSFTMVTSVANFLVSEIHPKERMPLLLDEDGVDIWMNPKSSINDCDALVKACPDEILERIPV